MRLALHTFPLYTMTTPAAKAGDMYGLCAVKSYEISNVLLTWAYGMPCVTKLKTSCHPL